LKESAPVIRLTRTFYLPQQSEESGRHDMWSVLEVESLSQDRHRIVLTLRGAVGVSSGNGQYAAPNLDFATVSGAGYVQGARKTLGELHKAPDMRLPLYRYSADAQDRLSWLSIDNTYFAAIVAPLGPDRQSAAYVAETAAHDLDKNALTMDDVTTSLVTTAQELSPGGRLTFPAQLYLGAKDRHAFREVPEYVARNYYYLLTAGVTWCTFSWLAELMIWVLNGLYFVVRDFGVAIIILVVIVRILLHPLTKKGQVNMVRMQKKAGEVSARVEEAKKKFGNDKARLQQETMRIYREVGINPAGQMLTCLPMLIQMPIWVALFFSLSNNVLMRHQPVHLTWIKDLTAPDALIPFSSPITVPLVGWQIASFNLLPILVAIFMYVQQKTQPRPEPNANMSEQQRQQQEMMYKMMPIMSIMMLFIFYNMPAGLNLYVMCSSLFGWLEQRRIRAHIREHEAAGTLHKPPKEKKEGEPRQLPGWLQKLQKAAEEAQKGQRTQRRDKRR
jgi:YidC/Oxa1 family membrane protein insertase